jgi:hypothetical protein
LHAPQKSGRIGNIKWNKIFVIKTTIFYIFYGGHNMKVISLFSRISFSVLSFLLLFGNVQTMNQPTAQPSWKTLTIFNNSIKNQPLAELHKIVMANWNIQQLRETSEIEKNVKSAFETARTTNEKELTNLTQNDFIGALNAAYFGYILVQESLKKQKTENAQLEANAWYLSQLTWIKNLFVPKNLNGNSIGMLQQNAFDIEWKTYELSSLQIQIGKLQERFIKESVILTKLENDFETTSGWHPLKLRQIGKDLELQKNVLRAIYKKQDQLIDEHNSLLDTLKTQQSTVYLGVKLEKTIPNCLGSDDDDKPKEKITLAQKTTAKATKPALGASFDTRTKYALRTSAKRIVKIAVILSSVAALAVGYKAFANHCGHVLLNPMEFYNTTRPAVSGVLHQVANSTTANTVINFFKNFRGGR